MVIHADAHKVHSVKLQQLAALHQWPAFEQASAGEYADTHLSETDRVTLAGIIPREAAVLTLVVGAANSALIRYLCDLSLVSTVIVLVTPEDLPDDEFVSQMRYYRRQVVPVYQNAEDGMRYIHAAGVVPSIVYHDITDITFDAMSKRLSVSMPLFSSAVHVGHAWSTEGIRKAVGVVAELRGREYDVYDDSVWIIREHGWRRQQRTRRRRQ